MGNNTSKQSQTTTTTTTITTTKTTKTTKKTKKIPTSTVKEPVNTSTLEDAVSLSTNTKKCKDELRELLGECTSNKDLIGGVVDFFEKNRSGIESSAATVAIAGALGLTILEASSDVSKSLGTTLGAHNLGLGAILGGSTVAAASVGAIFSGVALIATGCLLFRKYRVMQESGRVKIEVFNNLNKLRDDMTQLLEECNEESFFKIEKSRFRSLRRQIDVLYVLLRDIVTKLEKQRKQLNSAKKWIFGLSSVAIVTGVIFCFTGVGAAVGVALISGGVVGLACAYKLHKAEQEIQREIEFYRNTWKCIQDLEFILVELERLQKTKLVNTKEKFEKKIQYLKEFNKNLFDKYVKTLCEAGLFQDNGCEVFVPDEDTTLKDREKEFKAFFSDLDGKHENHLWIVVKGWVKEYGKIKSLFDTIFGERSINVSHNQKQQKKLQNGEDQD